VVVDFKRLLHNLLSHVSKYLSDVCGVYPGCSLFSQNDTNRNVSSQFYFNAMPIKGF